MLSTPRSQWVICKLFMLLCLGFKRRSTQGYKILRIQLYFTDVIGEKQFQRMFVNRMETVKISIFDKISEEVCGSSDHTYLASRYFHNKKSIRKEKLRIWLKTVCHILNKYCIPCLHLPDDDIQREACRPNLNYRPPESAY